jgi:hypothetical protein
METARVAMCSVHDHAAAAVVPALTGCCCYCCSVGCPGCMRLRHAYNVNYASERADQRTWWALRFLQDSGDQSPRLVPGAAPLLLVTATRGSLAIACTHTALFTPALAGRHEAPRSSCWFAPMVVAMVLVTLNKAKRGRSWSLPAP